MTIYHVTKALLSSALITSLCCALPLNAETKASALDYETVNKINATCLEQARKANYKVAIAIYDQGGVLLSFIRMDGAPTAVGEVARWKGLSAAIYQTKTSQTAKWNVPTAPKIATAQGGVPVFTKDGKALGGIGVSGAPPEFDESCGAAAAQSIGLQINRPG